MLQHCLPGLADAAPPGAGTAGDIQMTGRPATFAVRRFEDERRRRPALAWLSGRLFEFEKNSDEVSFRARGREAHSDQQNR